MQIDALIEALLFYTGESLSLSDITKVLECTEEEAKEGIETLKSRLSGGVVLLSTDSEFQLTTAPGAADIIAKLRQDELTKDLGKAATETLAIVAYRGPVTKTDIDFIRGVNSSTILRNLLMRGLITKIPNPKDIRGYLYGASLELLQYLGITNISELPAYNETNTELSGYFAENDDHGGNQ